MRCLTTGLLLVLAAAACAASPEPEVDAAFAALRNGDAAAVSSLAERGPAIVPAVARYLTDGDEDLRREAVTLLGTLEGEQACRALLNALTDPSHDIRERAARSLYGCDPAMLARDGDAGPAIRGSVALGNGAAAAALLLGYFPDDATHAALETLAEHGKQVKLENWMAPVPAALAAAVSLARLQQQKGRDGLRGAIDRGVLDEQVFLLSVLREIDDGQTLRSLGRHVSDRREIPYGVPSGATPRRRLCDMAVNAFAARLDLQLGFPLSTSRRYSDDQLKQAKTAVDAAVDRL